MNKTPIDWPIAFGNTFHGYPNPGTLDTSREWSGSYSIVKKNPRINKSYSPIQGYGLINAANALSKLLDIPVPDVPKLGGNQWFLDRVKAPAVWAQGYQGEGVTVLVVDTGCQITHPAIRDNLWVNPDEIPGNNIDDDLNSIIDDVNGFSFVNFLPNRRAGDISDSGSHGTHVAHTILQVAPKAKVAIIKASNNGSGIYGGSAPFAATYAHRENIKIINYSAEGVASIWRSNLRFAPDTTLFIAAGNDALPYLITASALAYESDVNVVAVGATTNGNVIASFSQKSGPATAKYLLAPGQSIYAAIPTDRYINKSGTSMSTPVASGIAALMLSAKPDLKPKEMIDLLLATAEPIKV